MFPSRRPKDMTEAQIEEAVMDVLMEGAGTEQEVSDETGLSADITRRVIRNLCQRGLVEPYITKHGKPMWDMTRTKRPA